MRPLTGAALGCAALLSLSTLSASADVDDVNDSLNRVGPDSVITTVAGTGVAGDLGDGGPALEAELRQPRDTAVAPDGSIVVVDTRNNRVRQIWPDGLITTIAGTGAAGSAGDGGPATEAELKLPHDVAFDDEGNLYIADANNHLIRKVDLDGVITTVAGTGEPGFNGDDIPAVEAQLRNPKSVVVRGNGLFIADSVNQRIRRVGLNSGIISTVVGSGIKGDGGDGGPALEAMLNVPQRIAFGRGGDLYIADAKNNRIRMVDGDTDTITTVLGTGEPAYTGDGGLAVEATIATPRGVSVDGIWLYVADSGNNVIRRVNTTTGMVRTIAGTGEAGYAGDGGPGVEALLDGPRGLSVDATGRLVIADTKANAVRVMELDPTPNPDPDPDPEPTP